MTGKKSKNSTKGTELAEKPKASEVVLLNGQRQEFAILTREPEIVRDLVRENIGEELTMLDLDRIRIPAGGGMAWEVPTLEGEGGDITKEIVGVIIAHKFARVFWEQSIDEAGGGNPADCSSTNGRSGVPLDFAAAKAGGYSGVCKECPKAEFGSADKGRGQACSQRKQLFIITPDDLLPIVVNLPPTSIRETSAYLRRLASRGKMFHSVVTRLTLRKDQNQDSIEYSRVVVTQAADLSPEQAEFFAKVAVSIRGQLDQTLMVDAADVRADDGRVDGSPRSSSEESKA